MTTKKNLVKTMFMNLQTDIYVNNDINPLTRAAGSDIPAYAAKYVDENNVIHPAVIHLTDPYGYDNDVHYPGDEPSANQTRAAQSGEYQYITADELAASNTRWGIRKRLLAYDKTIGNKLKHAAKGSSDSIYVEYEIKTDFELNYFLTLEGGMKWSGILPEPYVKKFETGVDGHFDFGAKIEFGVEREWKLKEKDGKIPLAKFPGYTFTTITRIVISNTNKNTTSSTMPVTSSLNMLLRVSISSGAKPLSRQSLSIAWPQDGTLISFGGSCIPISQ